MRGDGNTERLKKKTLQAQSVLKEFVREIFANYYNPWDGTLTKSETWILAQGVKWTPRHVMIFRAVEKAIEEELKNDEGRARDSSVCFSFISWLIWTLRQKLTQIFPRPSRTPRARDARNTTHFRRRTWRTRTGSLSEPRNLQRRSGSRFSARSLANLRRRRSEGLRGRTAIGQSNMLHGHRACRGRAYDCNRLTCRNIPISLSQCLRSASVSVLLRTRRVVRLLFHLKLFPLSTLIIISTVLLISTSV